MAGNGEEEWPEMEEWKGVLTGAWENGVRVAICEGEVVAGLAFETAKPVEVVAWRADGLGSGEVRLEMVQAAVARVCGGNEVPAGFGAEKVVVEDALAVAKPVVERVRLRVARSIGEWRPKVDGSGWW